MLGMDYGRARIGIAIGNRLTATARALKTIARPRDEAGWAPLDGLVQEWRPDRLLVGLPLDQDDGEQQITRQARHFAQAVAQRYQLPVDEVDERYSSVAAESELRGARAGGLKARRNRSGDIDGVAAALLVEQWLHKT